MLNLFKREEASRTEKIEAQSAQPASDGAKLPSRLHHTAFVSSDLEATRQFYEDLIGLPLVATWCEKDELFGAERVFAHCFFGLADGSSLAFFQFAEKEDQELFTQHAEDSPFRHIALKVDKQTQEALTKRVEAAGYEFPKTYTLEHGYCRSLYVRDPDGMIVEFVVDAPNVADIDARRRADAHDELKRWLAGDRTVNNDYRSEARAEEAAS